MRRIPPLFRVPLGPVLSHPAGVYWRPNGPFVDELTTYLAGKPVLEIFAGNGYLAGLLAQRGIDIRATTRLSSHDAHDFGMFFDVEEMEAEMAVQAYGQTSDVLLISWPTTTQAVLRAARLWGPEKPVVYIGELGDIRNGVYAGCASDEFFDALRHGRRFKTYQGRQMEVAMECWVR